MVSAEYSRFDSEAYLTGVIEILWQLQWDDFHYDSDLTRRLLTAPGITTTVVVSGGEVIGFAQLIGDVPGLQTHLSLLAVKDGWRRRGIAKMLVEESFRRTGAERLDLIRRVGGFLRILEAQEKRRVQVISWRWKRDRRQAGGVIEAA